MNKPGHVDRLRRAESAGSLSIHGTVVESNMVPAPGRRRIYTEAWRSGIAYAQMAVVTIPRLSVLEVRRHGAAAIQLRSYDCLP